MVHVCAGSHLQNAYLLVTSKFIVDDGWNFAQVGERRCFQFLEWRVGEDLPKACLLRLVWENYLTNSITSFLFLPNEDVDMKILDLVISRSSDANDLSICQFELGDCYKNGTTYYYELLFVDNMFDVKITDHLQGVMSASLKL